MVSRYNFGPHLRKLMCWQACAIYLSILSLVSAAKVEDNLTTLQLVQVLFRHGDREQIWSYPAEPKNSTELSGKLTNIGKLQEYDLGHFLRKRYEGFLGPNYEPHRASVLASDKDRTVMSAEMVLAGLYEPQNPLENWNPLIDWDPVPFRTIPKMEDKLLGMTMPCPRHDRLIKEILRGDYVTNLTRENQELIDIVRENTGIPGSSVADITFVGDILQVEKYRFRIKMQQWFLRHSPAGIDLEPKRAAQFHINNLAHKQKVPKWSEGIFEQLHALSGLMLSVKGSTTDLKRLRGGPLLQAFLSNMDTKASFPENPEKIYLFSAHESTLAYLMRTLSVFDPIMPPYAAALILELHLHPRSNKSYVQIYYRNETGRAPYELRVPGCGSPCFLEVIVERTKHLISDNWEHECLDRPVPSISFPNSAQVPVIRVVLSLGTLMAAMISLVCVTMKKQGSAPFKKPIKTGYESI